MHDVGTIVIIDDREKCNNSIYKAYSKEMLKSYIRAFLDSGISCFWKKWTCISPFESGLNNSEQKFGDYKIGNSKKFGSGIKCDWFGQIFLWQG